MKTLKYRSIFGALATAALSVFLFTACEKESDGYGTPQKPDRLSKFKRLVFTGSSSTTTTNSGSGTFIGNNNSINFTAPDNGGGTEFVPASAAASENEFTDPRSTGSSFVVNNSFTLGGGTVTLGSNSYNIDVGFCASSDVFGQIDGLGGGEQGAEIDMFIGVSGDFSFGSFESDTGEVDDMPINLLLYAFSINGSNRIGDFAEFQEETVGKGAFVVAVEFNEKEESAAMYFSTSGSVDFTGSNVSLSGVKMAKIEEGEFGDELSSTVVNLSAYLECGSYEFEEEEDTGTGPM